MTQATTPWRNRRNPVPITPDASIQSPAIRSNNWFNILAEEDNSETSTTQQYTQTGSQTGTPELDIKAADGSIFVCNTMDAELESNSDFTMSTEQDKLCLISKDALKSRMEVIKPGVTAPEANPKMHQCSPVSGSNGQCCDESFSQAPDLWLCMPGWHNTAVQTKTSKGSDAHWTSWCAITPNCTHQRGTGRQISDEPLQMQPQ